MIWVLWLVGWLDWQPWQESDRSTYHDRPCVARPYAPLKLGQISVQIYGGTLKKKEEKGGKFGDSYEGLRNKDYYYFFFGETGIKRWKLILRTWLVWLGVFWENIVNENQFRDLNQGQWENLIGDYEDGKKFWVLLFYIWNADSWWGNARILLARCDKTDTEGR